MNSTVDTNQLSTLGLGTQDRRFEKLQTLKKDPRAAAVVSKLVRNMDPTGAVRTHGQGADTPAAGYLTRVSEETASTVTDTTNLYQLLPDTELAEKILVSSILSPKDMVTTELNYVIGDTKLPPEITGPMLTMVAEFFTKAYKIDSLLPTILSDILFRRGSYPMLIIPESSVDDIINNSSRISMESLRAGDAGLFNVSIGLLADSTLEDGKAIPQRRVSASMESMVHAFSQNINMNRPRVLLKGKKFDTRISVSDNPDILKAPFLQKRIQQQTIIDTFKARSYGMEARQEVSRDDIEGSFYKPRGYQPRPVVSMKTDKQLEKKTVGHPLVMRLPSESIIPVHVPGSPDEHVGYFVLLDTAGNPLNKANRSDYYNDLSSNMSASKDMASQLLKQGQRAVEGFTQGNFDTNIDQATKIYAELIEEDLVARLRNGIYTDNVEIARPLEVYRIMLARTFANMSTQLLYVPVELVSYMAFDYNNYGVGKSLLEDNKILASLRVMMLLANTMSAIRNSVPHTGLNIQLDPNDPDPSTTVEKLVHNYAQTRRAGYPLGASSPVDIINFLQDAGIDLHVTGSPAYPETRMDVEDRARSIVEPNNELEESLKKRYLMSLGMSPETVDNSYNAEFATSIVTSNLLLTKRVMVYQDLFTAQLSEFIRKYILNSGEMTEKLFAVIEAAIKSIKVEDDEEMMSKEEILQEFIRVIEVTLPRPDGITLARQMEAFDDYVAALEKCLDAYFNGDFLDGTALGDQADQVETVKAAMLAHFKRKWLRDNNVMPELQDLVTFTEDKHPMVDLLKIHGEHVDSIAAGIQGYMVKIADSQKQRDEATAKISEQRDLEIGGGGGGSDGSDDSADDEGGADDEFGNDDDEGLDELEAESEEEEPEQEEEEEEPETEEEEDDAEPKPDAGEESSVQTDVIIQPED